MTLILYYHPFSSYCQKALIALYERELAFEPFLVDLGDERQRAEFAALWPYAKFPVLHDIDNGVTLPESSMIVEYADGLSDRGPRLLPTDPVRLRNTRLWDRTLDNYLHAPMQKLVADRLRPEGARDPHGVAEARATIATTYGLLERTIPPQGWLTGPDFSLADCAAAPPLFYAARLVPFTDHPRLQNYFERLMDRPSFYRCFEQARSYREFFPAAPGDAPWPDELPSRVAF